MESLNLAHAHLLLNHLPTIGFGMGLAIYIAAYFAKNDHLKKAGLVIFFLVAVMAIPTYMTGSAAERVLCPELKCPADVSVPMIRKHEDAALIAFVLMEITGFFSWLALWQLRRTPKIPSINRVGVLLLSVISFGLMALAATEGGEIRHTEIREKLEAAATPGAAAGPEAAAPAPAPTPEGAAAPGAAPTTEPSAAPAAATAAPPAPAEEEHQGIARSIGSAVAGNTGIGWLWPAFETIHFVGLCMLFAVVLMVDLRILGMAKGLSFQSLYQLLPFGMLGFILNLATGMGFFLAAPGQYVHNVEFHRKIVFVVLAGINVLYFLLFDEAWKIGPNDDAPFRSKAVAAVTIFLWLGILYYGHMLPFLGNSF